MARQVGEQHEHAETVLDLFAHADNAAAANLDAGVAHMRKRIDAVLQGTRGDDLVVKLGRGVDVVVVEVEPGLTQPHGLRRRQHAKRRAGFHAEILDRADHAADLVEITVFRIAPCGRHTEAARAGVPGAPRGGDHVLLRHQLGRLQAGVVMRALRAVTAVLGTAAGLDTEQARGLDMVWIEMPAMDALRAKHQVRERQGIEGFGLRAVPIAPDRLDLVAAVPLHLHSLNHCVSLLFLVDKI
ncbi:hypothetical protein GALL_548030 [mine drainage metagenome]|uniref:Uncharacterized protein n=1 Tax=mine drainage metagenome TaxID=410659 RepID=A0A1J5NZH7_9ZZZZ